jgi:head-tail adaptor
MLLGIDKFFYDIDIERPTQTSDEWSGGSDTFATYKTIKGLIRQLNGHEANTSQKDTAIATHRLYCRIEDILTTDRVLYNSIYYSITRVNNVMNFDELMQVDLWQQL